MRPALILVLTAACWPLENAGPELPEWTPVEPVLRVGAIDGDSAYQLYEVRDATRLPDGRLVVANAGSHEIRVFGLNGTHLVTFGGQGNGPADLMRPEAVQAVEDSLYVFDRWLQRLSVWLPDGRFVRVASLDPPAPGAAPVGWLDGAPVVMDRYGDGSVLVYGVDGTLSDTIAAYETPSLIPVSESRRMAPHFSAIPAAVAAGGRVYVSDARERRVDALDVNGNVVQTIRWEGRALEVTAQDWSAFRRQEGARIADMVRAEPYFPALAELRATNNGALWVREYDRPGDPLGQRWLEFDESGQLRGRVRLPEQATLLEVGPGYVIVLELGEFDVETVALYER